MEGRTVELLKGKPVRANLAEEPAQAFTSMDVKSRYPTRLTKKLTHREWANLWG